MSEYITSYFNNIANGVKSFISGLALTWDHLKNKKEKVATLQYPHEKFPVPEKKIGFDHSEYNVIRSRLHVDIDDCIGCLQCERACPVDCIKIDTIKPPKDSDYDCGKTSHDTQKKMLVPRFTIDMSECMYCNLCVYPCPEECIYMVGGPNEDKHEIDYEFSQYKREGMIFEFTNVTDEQIVDIGAEDYLKKRKEKEEKIIEGERLLGIKEEQLAEVVDEDKDKPKKEEPESGLSLKVFDHVEDKMARGIAKKAFVGAKRQKMNYPDIANYVKDALSKMNKLVEGMDKAITDISSYIEPETSSSSANNQEISQSQDETEKVLENNIQQASSSFDIKSLDVIEDRVLRGTAKKVFLGSKKLDDDDNVKIDKIISELKSSDKFSDDLEKTLLSFKGESTVLDNESNDIENKNNESSVSAVDLDKKELFDIKKLNDIDDRVIRGTLKKIYMAGKKANKTSEEVLNDMKDQLKADEKLNDDLLSLLEGIDT